eukprot:SAG31_NODE_322_length_17726_cov_18.070006_12_plen_214_part_00
MKTTIGERKWHLDKPQAHLASKKEILTHFEDIVAACTAERNIELVTLFGYESRDIVDRGAELAVSAFPLQPDAVAGGLPPLELTCSRLIKAHGFDVRIKQKIKFSAITPSTSVDDLSASVIAEPALHSLSPTDVLTPAWNVKMRQSAAPIWVLGSGKTAMDVIYHLANNLPEVHSRISCIAGHGTWFMNRDVFFPYATDGVPICACDTTSAYC